MPVINLHGTPTFQGEAMLLGWAENNRDGMTVRLALDATDENGHPFKGLGTGKHGQRFMVVCVPVDEENSPAPSQGITGGDPSEPSSDEVPAAGSRKGIFVGQSEQAPKRAFSDLPMSQQAALMCDRADFQEFMAELWDIEAYHMGKPEADDTVDAVRRYCDVKSRSELATNAEAGARWLNLLNRFAAWQTDQQYGDMVR